jgi:hypothetical protein
MDSVIMETVVVIILFSQFYSTFSYIIHCLLVNYTSWGSVTPTVLT